jgi:predicted ester cyclase
VPETDVRETNKAVVRRVLETWNAEGETHIPDALIADSLVTHFPHAIRIQRDTRGRVMTSARNRAPRRRVRSEIALPRSAFPDQEFTEQIVIAENDLVFVAWDVTGTNKGKLYGRAPTGKRITVQGSDVYRIRNGKIVEHWDYFTKARTHALARLGLFDKKMQQYLLKEGLLGRGTAKGIR